MPDLAGHLAVTHEYDTAERDLEQVGMTLSRLPSEAGFDWRLLLPRGEQVEAWEPGTSGLSPPTEIQLLIEGVTAGKDLVPDWGEEASHEYDRFEDLARRLFAGSTPRPWLAGSGAA